MSLELNNVRDDIINGKTTMGIELGSTRIKTVLIGSNNMPIANGNHDWENSNINNIWTYGIDEIWSGITRQL